MDDILISVTDNGSQWNTILMYFRKTMSVSSLAVILS